MASIILHGLLPVAWLLAMCRRPSSVLTAFALQTWARGLVSASWTRLATARALPAHGEQALTATSEANSSLSLARP